MNQFLRLVWMSELPTRLQVTLTAFLMHADANGCSMFPSMARVAKIGKKNERNARRDAAELVDLGILLVVAAGGGRRRTTEYRFSQDALLEFNIRALAGQAQQSKKVKPGSVRPGKPLAEIFGNPDPYDQEPGSVRPENPDRYDRGSVQVPVHELRTSAFAGGTAPEHAVENQPASSPERLAEEPRSSSFAEELLRSFARKQLMADEGVSSDPPELARRTKHHAESIGSAAINRIDEVIAAVVSTCDDGAKPFDRLYRLALEAKNGRFAGSPPTEIYGALDDHLKHQAARLGIDRFADRAARPDSSLDLIVRVLDSLLHNHPPTEATE